MATTSLCMTVLPAYWGKPERAPHEGVNAFAFCLYIYMCVCVYGTYILSFHKLYLIVLNRIECL